MSEKKIAQRDKGDAPRYNPNDPKNAKVLKMRLPRNVRVLEDGTIFQGLEK